MTCEIQSGGSIELFFYGELPATERAEVQSHLKQCAVCREALDDLAMIRAALASRPDVATPPAGDWSGFMTRLDAAIQRSSVETVPAEPIRPWRHVLRVPARWPLAVAAVAAVLTLITASALSVLRQREVVRTPDVVSADAPSAPAVLAVDRPDPALVRVSEAHFERSKLVVLDLAMRDSTNPRFDTWPRERELATTLLNDTRLYRLAAEERGMSTLAGVMRDLELVLLQTSMSEQPDAESIAQLQRLIRRRDLLTKMNVVAAAGP